MWKTLFQSVQGSHHRRAGEACQDDCLASELQLGHETALVLVCADGSGSAKHGGVGARLACQTLSRLIVGELGSLDRLPKITREMARAWLRGVRQQLADEARSMEAEMRDLASTLLGAVMGETGAAFFQIGDGAIVIGRDASYEHIFWPRSGEYVNVTFFLTDARFDESLDFNWLDQRIDEVALLTDGLQRLAMDFRAGRAHGPFFAPMFALLRACPNPAELTDPLRELLQSPRVEERTDDDKTLVLATRLVDHGPVL
jgi:hypothetical protein